MECHSALYWSAIFGSGVAAGGVAAIAGFGIGSLLTPLLGLQLGTKIAIAAVSFPHFIGTAVRCWVLRKYIDKKVFFQFGISSIIGGLCGALLFWKTSPPALTIIFGVILIFASLTELTGFLRRIHVGKTLALVGGAISGFLGGLVGNQGGIRSAALLNFDIDKKVFVATATAVGLVVDLVRMPIYVITQGKEIFHEWDYILFMTAGVLIGTMLGIKFLEKIPEDIFRRVVAGAILLLGIFMVYKGSNFTILMSKI